MTTSARPYARYTSHVDANGRAEVRTISGLPTHSHLQNSLNNMNVSWISKGLRTFWEIALSYVQINWFCSVAARRQTGNGVKFSLAGSANKACVAGARAG